MEINSILLLTPTQLRKAADLKERIDALNNELGAILGGADVAPSTPSASGPKVKSNGRLTVGSAILEALKANGGVMDKTALLKAASALKGSKINEGSFNGEVQKLKGANSITSPGRGRFSFGKAATASNSAPAAEPKAKRKMSAAGRAKIAAAAKARWAKVRAAKPGK